MYCEDVEKGDIVVLYGAPFTREGYFKMPDGAIAVVEDIVDTDDEIVSVRIIYATNNIKHRVCSTFLCDVEMLSEGYFQFLSFFNGIITFLLKGQVICQKICENSEDSNYFIEEILNNYYARLYFLSHEGMEKRQKYDL